MTTTQKEIIRQVKDSGIRMSAVLWNDNSVKYHRGEGGVIVTYNQATDLYDLTHYIGFDTARTLDSIFSDQLGQAIMAMMAGRVAR